MARIETRISRFYRDSVESLLVFMALAIIAGFALGALRERFIEITALLVLVPPVLDTGGNINATFTARLATLINVGRIRPGLSEIFSKEVYLNMGSALIQAAVLSLVLGTAVHIILTFFGADSPGLLTTIGTAFISLLLLVALLVPALTAIVIFGTRIGLDPDTLAGPFATGLVDAVAVFAIYVSSIILIV